MERNQQEEWKWGTQWEILRRIHRWLLLDFFVSLVSCSRCSSSTLDSSTNHIEPFRHLLLLLLLYRKRRRLQLLLRFTRSASSMPRTDIHRIHRTPNRITVFIVILHRLHTHHQSLPGRTKAYPWTRIVLRFVSNLEQSILNSIDTSTIHHDSIPPSCSNLPRLSHFITVISMFYLHSFYSCSLFILLATFVFLIRKSWLLPPFFKRR